MSTPSGSSACLTARMAPTSSADRSRPEPALLEPADAVLGADRPAPLDHEAEHHVVDLVVVGGRPHHVDVDVAVAHVPEQQGARPGRAASTRATTSAQNAASSPRGQRHVELVHHARARPPASECASRQRHRPRPLGALGRPPPRRARRRARRRRRRAPRPGRRRPAGLDQQVGPCAGRRRRRACRGTRPRAPGWARSSARAPAPSAACGAGLRPGRPRPRPCRRPTRAVTDVGVGRAPGAAGRP